jgi:hypothetical protein
MDRNFILLKKYHLCVIYVINASQNLNAFKDIYIANTVMESYVSAESVIRCLKLNEFPKHTAKFIMVKHFLVDSVVDISQGQSYLAIHARIH